LERKEINRIIRRLKDDKVIGVDGVPNEETWRRNKGISVMVMQQNMERRGIGTRMGKV